MKDASYFFIPAPPYFPYTHLANSTPHLVYPTHALIYPFQLFFHPVCPVYMYPALIPALHWGLGRHPFSRPQARTIWKKLTVPYGLQAMNPP